MIKYSPHKEYQGKLCCLWESYWPNKTLEYRAYFHQGKRHGLYEKYLSDGTPQYKKYHLNIK